MKRNAFIFFLIIVCIFLLFLLVNQKTETNQNIEISSAGTVNKSKTEDDLSERPDSSEGTILDLNNQNLDKLPSYILSMTALEELDISNNNISGALPAEIRQLQNLKVLNASNNKMTGVPAEIGQLSKLEVLDLSNNQLTGLPYEIGNLKKLRVLDLSGNNYAPQDLEVIKEGLPKDTETIL